jgi:hypothetical protein
MSLELEIHDPSGGWARLAGFGFSVVVLLSPARLHGDQMKYGFECSLTIFGKCVETRNVCVREPGDRAAISHDSTTYE